MQKMKLMVVLLFVAGFGWGSAAEETLNDLLDRRIKMNEKYRDQYTEEAGESEFAEQLQPIEKEVGQAWVDYLKYVKSLKDDRLKEQVLRIELLHELSGTYYDLEFAEGVLEKAKLRGEIKKWEREIALLNEIVKGLGKAPQEDQKGAAETKEK